MWTMEEMEKKAMEALAKEVAMVKPFGEELVAATIDKHPNLGRVSVSAKIKWWCGVRILVIVANEYEQVTIDNVMLDEYQMKNLQLVG